MMSVPIAKKTLDDYRRKLKIADDLYKVGMLENTLDFYNDYKLGYFYANVLKPKWR